MGRHRPRTKNHLHNSRKKQQQQKLPISTKLIAMLNSLPKINDKVFQPNKHGLRVTFEQLRNRTAIKLKNPRLKQIHLHTFRHWKATMEYHNTKDIIHVQQMLGHRNIEMTMLYIQIEKSLFLQQDDQWTSKIAHNEQEETQLIDAGFEYVSERGELHFYRKRK